MAYSAIHVFSQCVSMTWWAKGLLDIARRIIGCQLAQETKVQSVLDDVVGNI